MLLWHLCINEIHRQKICRLLTTHDDKRYDDEPLPYQATRRSGAGRGYIAIGLFTCIVAGAFGGLYALTNQKSDGKSGGKSAEDVLRDQFLQNVTAVAAQYEHLRSRATKVLNKVAISDIDDKANIVDNNNRVVSTFTYSNNNTISNVKLENVQSIASIDVTPGNSVTKQNQPAIAIGVPNHAGAFEIKFSDNDASRTKLNTFLKGIYTFEGTEIFEGVQAQLGDFDPTDVNATFTLKITWKPTDVSIYQRSLEADPNARKLNIDQWKYIKRLRPCWPILAHQLAN